MTKESLSHIDLDHFWPYQTVVLADQISRYTLDVVRSEAGLNQSQWRVLAAVADRPGRTAAEVTAVTPMDKTIVSRAVHSLIDSGLIQKIPSLDDKRRSSLEMTHLGAKKYRAIAKILNDTLTAPLTDGTTTEQFVEILKQFSAQIKDIPQK
ncbi:MAG: MarR family transcriptional regulator [Acidimicrobiales bacterium]|nr:MAG: MarR family transcriptional regulator [Acidimicrobiales bacterium]